MSAHGTWRNTTRGAACPQPAEADIRPLDGNSRFDPSATLAVHCGNGFDADFSPLSKHSFEALGCRLLSLGEDMQRREFIKLIGGAAAGWPLAARAQQPAMPVIGFLNIASPETWTPYVAAFRQGAGQTGFVEGQNVAIQYRWAHGDYNRLPALAADLVSSRVS